MLKGAVARRYAQALLELGRENKQIDALEVEFGRFVALLAEHKELERVLLHPSIVMAEKKALVEPLLKEGVSPMIRNFIMLVIDRRREAFFQDIFNEYVRLANETRGLVKAEVTSVVPLQEQEVAQLKDQLNKMTGKTIQLEQRIDPSLLGGMVIRIGDKIIDGSVAGKLRGLQQALLNAPLPQ